MSPGRTVPRGTWATRSWSTAPGRSRRSPTRRSIASRSIVSTPPAYPAASSDIAALLVFDHQGHAMNLLTRLGWETRIAAAEGRSIFRKASLATVLEETVDYLLFVGRGAADAPVQRRSAFSKTFGMAGPRDRAGSLVAGARSADAAVQIPLQLHDLLAGVRRACRSKPARRCSPGCDARLTDRDTIAILDETKAGWR